MIWDQCNPENNEFVVRTMSLSLLSMAVTVRWQCMTCIRRQTLWPLLWRHHRGWLACVRPVDVGGSVRTRCKRPVDMGVGGSIQPGSDASMSFINSPLADLWSDKCFDWSFRSERMLSYIPVMKSRIQWSIKTPWSVNSEGNLGYVRSLTCQTVLSFFVFMWYPFKSSKLCWTGVS